ncbi:3'-5' exonuclease [Nocardia abscessus]|uniref:3'-5' exonuclease n=1 Tax=Nocardia abscessus TaxID=120957 RepID=UPI002458962C|nr:3'-5' exonuclease [Nocardia abscessus]
MIGSFGRRRADPLACSADAAEYLVIDLETAGPDPALDSIVSYGVVPIRDGVVLSSQGEYGLVRPGTAMAAPSIAIHTLRPCDLLAAPPEGEAVHRLDQLLSGRVLVAHSAWFECDLLKRAFRRNGRVFAPPVIDTAAMARAAGLAPAGHHGEPGLEWLCDSLGVPVTDRHHALGDAVTAAQLFVVLAARLTGLGYSTARSLVELTAAERHLGLR